MLNNPFAQNPFFSMLGQQPQFGQQQPFGGQQQQGMYGAARWLPGFLGQQSPQGGFMGGLAPWDYQPPTPEYIASFLQQAAQAAPQPAQSPLVTAAQARKKNRPGPGPDRDRSGVGGRAGSRGRGGAPSGSPSRGPHG